ncbi:AMP-binding protein [Desulfobotulus sp. H1]|uniref:AMP-binding protein n=1 Tax=Desulfobotulus pelophilus TaxID=2823377 RepID=A0ABT3N5R6_9BACT|nr:AMP-binding protein [Desulfobotulus pelophilus]MCW7752799.1 AMP-binding protein [Desulfobotulus pelophilus]
MYQQAQKWYLTRQTFPELFQRNVARFPDRPAQKWRDEKGNVSSLAYGRLGEVIREISGGLLSRGVKKGDRVAILAPTVPQWLWADYAILCSGAITVAVHPALSALEMAEQVQDSGARWVFIYGRTTKERFAAVKPECVTTIISLGPENDSPDDGVNLICLNDFREEGRRFFQLSPLLFGTRWRSVQPDDAMTLIYTSGTTGQPKGVLHTHASMTFACIRDLCAIPLLTEKDCLLSFLPLSHSFERQCGHGTAMFAAVPIAYGSTSTLGEDLRLFRPTYMLGVPHTYAKVYGRASETLRGAVERFLFRKATDAGSFVVEKILRAAGVVDMSAKRSPCVQGFGFSLYYRLLDFFIFRKLRRRLGGRIRFVFSAAGALPENICRLYLAAGIRLLEGYGTTETCNTIALNPVHAIKPGSVGVFCKGVSWRLAEDGELLVKGDFLFRGYWNNPAATNAAFTPDGFYRTGDVVELTEDGYLRMVDRKKGMIMLTTGHRVASVKLEALFSLSPYIENTVVVGDDRPFPVVLIEPNFTTFVRMFREAGIPFSEEILETKEDDVCRVRPGFVKIPELVAMMEVEIASVNGQLQKFEKIGGYVILHERLCVETGELTPTLKVRREVVLSRYRDGIEKVYQKGPVLE